MLHLMWILNVRMGMSNSHLYIWQIYKGEVRPGNINLGVISEYISRAKSLVAILGRDHVLDVLRGRLPGIEGVIEPLCKQSSQQFPIGAIPLSGPACAGPGSITYWRRGRTAGVYDFFLFPLLLPSFYSGRKFSVKAKHKLIDLLSSFPLGA